MNLVQIFVILLILRNSIRIVFKHFFLLFVFREGQVLPRNDFQKA